MAKNTDNINCSPLRTIKMSWLHLMNDFVPAFQFLANLPTNPKSGNLKYAIKRTLEKIQAAGVKYETRVREINEEAALKDEHGNPKFDDHKNYLFETPELRKAAQRKMDKLNAEEVEIQVYPCRLEHIQDTTKLTIMQEIALRCFIFENDGTEDAEFEQKPAAKKSAPKAQPLNA